jgi:GT2 family glycosyltransferase
VLIPSKNAENLRASLAAVRKHEPDANIIVIDDGLDYHPEAKTLAGERPFIFSRNMNAGIREAGRDDVVLLNDDAILETSGGFSLLQRASQEHAEFGVIAAATNASGNRAQQQLGVGLREDPRMVCFVAVLIPRRTLDRIGWLDERFTAYGFEDDDYCHRVKRAGLKVGIHDGCFVDHASLTSTYRGNAMAPASDLSGGRKIFEAKWGSYPAA